MHNCVKLLIIIRRTASYSLARNIRCAFRWIPSEENPADETPDLFAAERAEAEKRKASLDGLLGDLQASQKAEQERLKKLF